MTDEERYYIRILKDFLYGKKTYENKGISWEILYCISHSHQTEAIVYFQCKKYIPTNSRFVQSYYATLSDSKNKEKLIKRIDFEFRQKGITYFIVKGVNVAKFYKLPDLRTSGDIDIVVSDIEKAHDVLLNLGFDDSQGDHLHEWIHRKNNYIIELHDRLVYDETSNSKGLESFFNNYDSYVFNNDLDSSFHFCFLIFHLRKHIMAQGVGFRQFLDIASMSIYCKDLDWNWISQNLRNLGMDGFAQTVFILIHYWFDVNTPLTGASNFSEERVNMLTSQIFENGVFGFHNGDVGAYRDANAIINSNVPLLRLINRLLNLFFPSYSLLRRMKKYAFIDGKPILMPIAWIYRGLCAVHGHGMNRVVKEVKSRFVPSDYVSKRRRMYDLWGITAKE